MSTETFKNIIFYDDPQKTLFLATIIDRFPERNFSTFDGAYEYLMVHAPDNDLQFILAPFLRQLAIRQLENGSSEIMRNIRESYNTFNFQDGTFLDYLQAQSQDGAWACQRACTALAEILDISVQILDDRPNQKPYDVFENSISGRSICIHNRRETHFYIEKGNYHSTIGNGNCFYNAMAQHLRRFILSENTLQKQAGIPSAGNEREKALESFDNKYNELRNKVERLDSNNTTYKIGSLLLIDLQTYRKAFVSGESNAQEFKSQCKSAIHTALETKLGQEDWFKQFCVSLLTIVSMIPIVGYLASAAINSARWTLFKKSNTDSAKIVEGLESAVDAINEEAQKNTPTSHL